MNKAEGLKESEVSAPAHVGMNGVLKKPPMQVNDNGGLTTVLMVLLAFQFGLQPLILQKCMGPDVIATTSVLTCEVLKVITVTILLTWKGMWASTLHHWSLWSALAYSASPAAIYSLQNLLLQLSYRHLDQISFSLFNQSKLLFTALFMFIILGHKQSRPQIGALLMMVGAGVLLTMGQSPKSSSTATSASGGSDVLWRGIIPTVLGSVLSGIGSALCQLATQKKGKSSFLMTIEMSTVSCLLLCASLARSPDGAAVRIHGFFHGWTPFTFIPVFSSAVGGILVGLVTQYAGGVKKNFALVSALLVTACVQFLVDGAMPSSHVWIALPLVGTSTLVHSLYPPKAKVKAG